MAKLILDDGTIFEGTVEEIRKYMNLTRPRFRVGDYARIVNVKEHTYFEENDIVRVISIDNNDDTIFPICVEEVGGLNADWFSTSSLEPLTEEEIKEVKKWEAIGRKPFRYRVGDIVMDKTRETIGEVIEIGETFGCRLKSSKHSFAVYPESDLILVASVDHRLDLK